MVWLGGDLDAVKQSYRADPGPPADGGWLVHLTPRPGPLAEIVGTLDLTVTGEPAEVRRVLITEPDGDTVLIEFSDVQRGVTLTDAHFALPEVR